ncbi:alpha/beta fold hydrolase [Abyssibius alkaniclasticus]|uniref:alpha/beta fold hydrolase n=1 Tax=Abyssibius alkaniclasticus TaxID=2881234 RepID=UPI004058C549
MKTPDGTAYDWTGSSPQQPVVVLVHGLGLNRASWAPQSPGFAGFARLRYDLPGHGESAAMGGRATLPGLSAQLAGLLDHLKIHRAVVIGFSLGGMIARHFAQSHPHRTQGLVVINSAHARSARAQANILLRLAEAQKSGPAATVELALNRWFTPGFYARNPDVVDTIRQTILATDPDQYCRLYRVLAEDMAQIIAPVPPISCPALVMAAELDYGQSPDMARAMAAEIAGAEVSIAQGLNHMSPTECPAAINTPLAVFLRRFR